MKKVLFLVLALALWLALTAPVMAQRPTQITVPNQASTGAEKANDHQDYMELVPGGGVP